MLGTGFHDKTAVPVSCPSSTLSRIGRPVSADDELPVQVSVMIPAASDRSVALVLPSSGPSAACCAGQAVLLLLNAAFSVLLSCV